MGPQLMSPFIQHHSFPRAPFISFFSRVFSLFSLTLLTVMIGTFLIHEHWCKCNDTYLSPMQLYEVWPKWSIIKQFDTYIKFRCLNYTNFNVLLWMLSSRSSIWLKRSVFGKSGVASVCVYHAHGPFYLGLILNIPSLPNYHCKNMHHKFGYQLINVGYRKI